MEKINDRVCGFFKKVLFTLIIVFSFQFKLSPKSFQENDFSPYQEKVPGTNLSFRMIPVEAGTFVMGSPAGEAGRKEDEGPQVSVKIDPFWMAEFEVTWDLFEVFVSKEQEAKLLAENNAEIKNELAKVDGISRPTPAYTDMSFGMGKSGFPAVNMTHYAAVNFCKWLSAKTGNFYRLPTEAEWEYACRAGSKTAYFFGEDVSKLPEYAWYYDNSDGGYKKPGLKKPNPWGIYDIIGNVAEYTLDQYDPERYKKAGSDKHSFNKTTQLYPHVFRGGSWNDDPDRLRSASRRATNPKFKQRDPQIPRSAWWFTDASFLGLRVVRPLKEPTKEEKEKYNYTLIKDL